MAFTSGVFSLVSGNPVVTGTTISSTWANNTLTDIATNGLSICVLKDGSQIITANIPMATHKLTGLAAGSVTGDSVRYEQVLLLDGTNTMSGRLKTNTRATVASAATINLDTCGSNYAQVTGTTSITAITLTDGQDCTVEFSGALTLTNGASLILPGSANITTAAGDTAIFRGEASSVVRCISYTRATGVPVVSTQTAGTFFAGPASGSAAVPSFRTLVGSDAGGILLSSKTASASASLTFTSSDFDWTLYDVYIFELVNLIPAANDDLQIQVSFDGGGTPTWQTAANYVYATSGASTTAVVSFGSAGTTFIQVMNTVGTSTTGGGVSGFIRLAKPANASSYKHFTWTVGGFNNTLYQYQSGFGAYTGAATALLGVKFFASANNLSSGSIYVYGLRKA